MRLTRADIWRKSQKSLKTGWLIMAGLAALYFGTLRAYESRGISSSKETGLASLRVEPFWQETSYAQVTPPAESLANGAVRAISGGAEIAQSQLAASTASYVPDHAKQASDSDRKMVRTSALDLVVKDPGDTSEKIRQLAERLGGFLVNSATRGGQDAASASLTVRIPTDRFEQARAEIRKLGIRVDGEHVEAQDVTRQYVDLDANLRNLRAEETQYLSIMKRASTVKDTLEVSEKLSEVRGQIEQQQAEFEALSKQVETVAITVSLRTEAEAEVFGLHWRPLYQVKLAARDGLVGIGNYAAAIAGFAFLLPTILLWLVTILLGSVAGWRILRWVSRLFFGWPQTATAADTRS